MKSVQSIRARLLVLVLTVALPLVGLIAYNTASQARIDADDARAQASRAARVVAADTEQTLARTRALLLHLSKLPLVRALDGEHESGQF
jgi:hypothetical protein